MFLFLPIPVFYHKRPASLGGVWGLDRNLKRCLLFMIQIQSQITEYDTEIGSELRDPSPTSPPTSRDDIALRNLHHIAPYGWAFCDSIIYVSIRIPIPSLAE